MRVYNHETSQQVFDAVSVPFWDSPDSIQAIWTTPWKLFIRMSYKTILADYSER